MMNCVKKNSIETSEKKNVEQSTNLGQKLFFGTRNGLFADGDVSK